MSTTHRPIVFRQTSTQIVETLRKRLDDQKGRWAQLSAMSRVPYFTICKLSQGITKYPRMDTFVDLSQALDRLEAGEEIAVTRSSIRKPVAQKVG